MNNDIYVYSLGARFFFGLFRCFFLFLFFSLEKKKKTLPGLFTARATSVSCSVEKKKAMRIS